MMYKTVRKGDASLQYTILPQSDQFNTNGLSQSTSQITGNVKSRSRIIKYTICTLMLIVLSCVATPFLINQNDHNLFAGTILVMGRVGYETTTTPTTTTTTTTSTTSTSTTAASTSITSSSGSSSSSSTSTTIIENALKSDQISEEEDDDDEEDDDEEEEIIDKSKYQVPVTKTRPRTTTTMITSTTTTATSTTTSSSSSKNKDFDNLTMPIDSFRDDELESSDTLSPDEIIVEEALIHPTDSSSNIRHTSSYLNSQSSSSSTQSSEFLKSSLSSSSIESSEMTKVSSGNARKAKMPRVTLKLRENETIPQMYMKAGIASYKKGNITTSVLAHGLSLEGLIFKTPEGTIKPWEQKWFFSDPSSDFQWKDYYLELRRLPTSQGPNQTPLSMYILLAGLAGLAILSIVLLFYVQRKASRRQRHDIEEPETEIQEEDKSTLLDTDNHEIEDKD
ncbi:hypothetical protein M0802_005542 [Mischocyttarus mexicanus]|nr:hypothetical protein M0802_005542 [Mischocyttarus mexicanus]